jgi:Bacterial membrane protein YfhO
MWFSDIFLDYVPGYDKFRAVAMTLVIAGFTFPLMAAILLDRIVTDSGDFIRDNRKKITWIAGALLGITLLFCISPSTFTSFYSEKDVDAVTQDVKSQGGDAQVIDAIVMNLEAARKNIMVEDSMRTFFFLFLALLLLFGYIRFKFKSDYLIYGLLFLTLVDLWTVGRRYLGDSEFTSAKAVSNPFPMTAADQYMLQDTSTYRVLNFAVSTFNDASTSYYHQSIGGYHGAKLKRYKELIDSCLNPEMNNIRVAFGQGDTAARLAVASQPALNMLNAKYIVYNPEAAPLMNPGSLGNAWFVKSVRLVPNADAEIAAVNKLNPAEEAVVDERFKEQVSAFRYTADSTATVKMTSYEPNHLVYSYQSSAPQLTVFSEIYYDKGWNAYVDGKEAPYFRTNYVLRGMVLPAGKHTVDFKFEPTVYVVGEKISLAGSLILIGLLVYLVYSEVKKLRAEGKTETKPQAKV